MQIEPNHYRLEPLPRGELAQKFRWTLPPCFNLATDTVDRVAATHPNRVALIEARGRRVRYGELRELSNRLANALREVGVKKGERVGILLRQSLECALAHLAVYKLGAIALPLSTLFGQDALSYRLEHSGARFLIAEREVRLDDPPSGRTALAHPEALQPAVLEGVRVIYADELLALAQAASAGFLPEPTHPDDPAILIYTSGTTGKPKGALLAQRVLLGHLPGFYLYSNFPQDEAVYWSPADWAWIGGLLDVLFPAWFYGFTVVAHRAPKFDPQEALELMRQHGVTHSFLFPTALKLLRGLGRIADPPRLKSIHSGGEPLGEGLQEWSRENFGLPVNEFYGQTEANLLVGNSYLANPIRPGSMGMPYPGHRVVVIDEEGKPLPPGEVGEVALETPDPVAFLGYWNNEAATREKFVGPYLRTGDLAVRDEEGYLWFKARKDDLIKAAGYRISPFEVEEALLRHPAVAMAAVVGQPDPERGQRVVAYVKLHPGQSPDEALVRALQQEVRSRVGHHAYPRAIHFVEELPMTTTGKIQRFKLRSQEP
jgi:acetyl-CoA synthetase